MRLRSESIAPRKHSCAVNAAHAQHSVLPRRRASLLNTRNEVSLLKGSLLNLIKTNTITTNAVSLLKGSLLNFIRTHTVTTNAVSLLKGSLLNMTNAVNAISLFFKGVGELSTTRVTRCTTLLKAVG